MIKEDPKTYCRFCFNARIYKSDEEDLYSLLNPLTDENDFNSHSVAVSSNQERRIMITSGYGKSTRIEMDEWNEQMQRWITPIEYYPKFCPECGRRLDEYEKNNCD